MKGKTLGRANRPNQWDKRERRRRRQRRIGTFSRRRSFGRSFLCLFKIFALSQILGVTEVFTIRTLQRTVAATAARDIRRDKIWRLPSSKGSNLRDGKRRVLLRGRSPSHHNVT